MDLSKLIEEINCIDWRQFNGPPYYQAEKIPLVLNALVDRRNSKKMENIGGQILNAIGNNHQGVYYPVVLRALDLLIEIEKGTENNEVRVCAKGILNDIYYFQPDVEGYDGCSAKELKSFVTSKLEPYSDENIVF